MAGGRAPRVFERVELLRGGEASGCVVRVQEVRGALLAITPPMQGSRRLPLPAGERCTLRYYDAQAEYRLPVTVLDPQEGEIGTVWLRVLGNAERVQRRRDVRLGVGLPVTVWLERAADADGHEPPSDPARRPGAGPWPGETINLSGGGIKFLTAARFVEGDAIQVEFALPDGLLRCAATVIRRCDPPVRAGGMTDRDRRCYGATFTRIRESDRERIVRWIFEEQRKRRQWGLI